MMKTSGIYQIQSIIKPENIYIGSAVNIENRKRGHLCKLRNNRHNNIKLQNHFNKYGEGDLIFSVLLICNKEDLIKNEQYFLNTYSPWFNICKTAGRLPEAKRSPLSIDHRNKISIALVGNKNALGTTLTEERKQKLREACIRNNSRPPSSIGNKYNLGRHHLLETKEKMSNSQKLRRLKEKQNAYSK